jgi:glycosyltransferase involved in cell wall biosynthesis
MISVLILTRNEEWDLPGCLASVHWSDDIHVFDSFSTDQTVQIAESAGARVTQRLFGGYASQRNAALHSLPFHHDWVLILDADERVPGPLAAEIEEFAVRPPSGVAAARIRRRDYLMGAWLKHAQISPYFIRLVKPLAVHYEREVNEVMKVDGEVFDLQNPYDHYPFSKGIRHWIEKHNVYSTMEAEVAWKDVARGERFSLKKALFARDFNERRFHQKGLFFRLPFRPLLKFAYMMLVRRAFLDGRAGVTYALLQSIYEYFIILKTRELEAARGKPDSTAAAKKPDSSVQNPSPQTLFSDKK